jgi:hypothetical protein
VHGLPLPVRHHSSGGVASGSALLVLGEEGLSAVVLGLILVLAKTSGNVGGKGGAVRGARSPAFHVKFQGAFGELVDVDVFAHDFLGCGARELLGGFARDMVIVRVSRGEVVTGWSGGAI